jgi:hypothetical protein
MRRRTLSRTFVCCLLALAGCGSDDDEPSVRTERFHRTELTRPAESGKEDRRACALISARRIAHLLGEPRVRAIANDSTDLSICDWRGGGKRAELVLDTAPKAQLRYYNQLAEQLQFHNPEPTSRPHQLKHVGDDSAYGGAGAWWTPSKEQLVAYRDDRILRVRAPDRKSAVRLARLAFRRLSEPGR